MAVASRRRKAQRAVLQRKRPVSELPNSKRCPASGKLGYKTREDAVVAASIYAPMKPSRIYPCPACGRFHLSTKRT